MRKLLLTLSLLVLTFSTAFAQPTMDYEQAPLGIASGSTVFYPYLLKFPDNSYTDNGATGTITFTGTGHTIQDEGVSLTQRTNLNFVGAGVTASDNGADTVITIPGAGGSSASAGGVTTNVQYNNSGVLAGDSNFEYFSATNTVVIAGSLSVSNTATGALLVATTQASSPILRTDKFSLPTVQGSTGQVVTLQTNGTSLWQTPATNSSTETDPIWSGVKANYVPYSGATGSVLTTYDVSANRLLASGTSLFTDYKFQSATGNTLSLSASAKVVSLEVSNIATTNILSINATDGHYYLPYKTGSTGQVITLQTTGESVWQTPSTGGSSSGYSTIEDEGSALTQRTTMNFTGSGVTASDSGGKTVVNIPGASNAASSGSIIAVFDGGGSVIATNAILWARLPYSATLTEWDITAYSTSPTLVVDVQKSSYAGFGVTSNPSIAASAKPTLTSQQKNTDTTLTGWTKSISAGDYIYFVVNNIDTATYAVVILSYTK